MTEDIQINDTNLHAPLKTTNQELGKSLMIDQLRTNPKKIPQPTWDDMMGILEEIFKSSEIDVVNHFKALWVTNALDGSEDCLVSERLMSLVGENIKAFHDQLKKKKSQKNLMELLKLIEQLQQSIKDLKDLKDLIVTENSCRMKKLMSKLNLIISIWWRKQQ